MQRADSPEITKKKEKRCTGWFYGVTTQLSPQSRTNIEKTLEPAVNLVFELKPFDSQVVSVRHYPVFFSGHWNWSSAFKKCQYAQA